MASNFPNRFYLLDILRGLASLSVVVWHYSHFFFTDMGRLPPNLDLASRPLYDYLFIFYQQGLLAVNLFFVLSGFIFFWLYFDQVKHRKVSAREFFVLRFSRLYPLHFAALILVAAGQWLWFKANGGYFVFPYNDFKHFILNLFFVSY